MRPLSCLALLALACVGPPAADAPEVVDGAVAGAAFQEQASVLAGYDFEERLWYVDLPGRLEEVSGLAFSPDGRLFAHDDERGRIHEIDPSSGALGKRFDLGEDLVLGDFEGLAIVGERFFAVVSTGLLYEFREGGDGENVEYQLTDTGLGAGCEIEGFDVDPIDQALLFACKVATPGRGTIVVQRLPLDPAQTRPSPLEVARTQLEAWNVSREFAPSGIAVSPSGTFLILSGRNDAIIEVDRAGQVVGAVLLSKGRHPQSEGIAFGPDGSLYVSDEKNGKAARLTSYIRRSEESPR
ncbi:MAG: SdiA-regulated domain-containing protein [Longimicrobiales bacterium]